MVNEFIQNSIKPYRKWLSPESIEKQIFNSKTDVELRKIKGNGVELEAKLKVQWRWSGVEVKTSGGGAMNELMMELE